MSQGTRFTSAAERGRADILMVGPYPPPIGGVSAHVARLVPLLMQHGLVVHVLSHYGLRADVPYVVAGLRRNPLRYFIGVLLHGGRLVHYHHSTRGSLVAVALALVLRPRCPRIISIHSPAIARDLARRPSWIMRWSLRRFDHIIVVTPEIAGLLAPITSGRLVSVIPAFIPSAERRPIPAKLAAFVSSAPTFVAAAWRLRFLSNGDDLYGFDLLAQAFVLVAKAAAGSRLVLLVGEPPRGAAAEHLASVRGLLDGAGLHSRYMVAYHIDLSSLLDYDVILVRPTRTDGDAVSVREALAKSRVVIASDAAVRPAGTRVVATSDVGGLAAAMEEAVASHSADPAGTGHLAPTARVVPLDGAKLLDIYRGYLRNERRLD